MVLKRAQPTYRLCELLTLFWTLAEGFSSPGFTASPCLRNPFESFLACAEYVEIVKTRSFEVDDRNTLIRPIDPSRPLEPTWMPRNGYLQCLVSFVVRVVTTLSVRKLVPPDQRYEDEDALETVLRS